MTPCPTSWLSAPAHTRWLEAEGDRLLEFGRASRSADGGFAWLDEEGRPAFDRPVELWITCRMTHVFSLGHLMGRAGCGPLADHGLAAMAGRFRDAAHGGWYAAMDGDGPTGREKSAYPHAFVVIAAASATCAGRPGAAAILDEALDVLLTRFWDEKHGMVVEEWDETFSTLDPYRGVNANMHTVEAFLAAADATRDAAMRTRLLDGALRIVTRVVHGLGKAHSWRLPEHFDEQWTPLLDYNIDTPAHPFRPYGATIGHWLEWARLALHLRAALGADSPDWLLDDAISLFDASILEGWAADGRDGFVYTVDWAGKPVVRERMHWVAAEATATAAALHTATGDPSYADWYATWWEHIADVFIDRDRGSWRHELDAHNRPSGVVWSGKPDTYHAFQATLIPRLPLAPTMAAALRDGLLQ
ncbi:AGE family epimerase/isomerase [Aeromicrobium sp.]|uniref:AGE family epimerase/isomerase n=1 Tax=Aeromicrobium sp. TaxID=1871063 RepID=UPI002FC94DAA